ncbi:MAG: SPOR domain-containing protein [candidate division KSB1 bacterium]|nr:SPOR domain-containing protein [candidate division KSB1 bacterium]
MMKEAVGIAINGREVKIAHLYRDKNRLGVDFLETAILAHDMDYEINKKVEETAEAALAQNDEDIFASKTPYEGHAAAEKESNLKENIDVIYSLVRKFASRRIRVAFNAPPYRVNYQDLDTHLDYDKKVFRGSLKKKIDQWKKGFNELDNVSVIARKDGTLCNVSCEIKQPPIIDILEQLNTFFKGNLFLNLMDPNEIALVNLAKTSYDFRDANVITVIIEIETEFSRLIFMRGEDLLTVSPIIPENFNPDIFDIIYSKIIYELDNLNLTEINNILLAGKASTNAAKSFFEKKFKTVRVGFVVSQPLAENLSTQFAREDLSEYAIPISLAWKAVAQKDSPFIPTNLLPAQIIDRQKMLTLDSAGYLILVLLGLSAFILTWKITAKNIEVHQLRNTNRSLTERIASSEGTVKRVQDLEEQINKLTKRIILSDSLSYGSDRLLTFLELLNQTVLSTKSVWIDEIQSTTNGINLKGVALKRKSVPELSEALGVARIRKLTRFEIGGTKAFAFEMEVDWKNQPFRPNSIQPSTPGMLPPVPPNQVKPNLVTNTITDGNRTITATQEVVGEGSGMPTNYPAQSMTTIRSEKSRLIEQETAKLLAEIERMKSEQATQSEPRHRPESNAGVASEAVADGAMRGYPAQPSSSPEPTVAAVGQFTIKISAHANKLTAAKEVQKLHRLGIETYITRFANSSPEIPYWVCCGRFSSYAEAQQELQRLQKVVPGSHSIIESNTGLPLDATSSASRAERIERAIENHDYQNIKQANQILAPAEAGPADASISHPAPNSDTATAMGREWYTIGINAHATRLTAQKEVESLRSKGHDAFMAQPPDASSDVPYWVCLGRYHSQQTAIARLNLLRKSRPGNYKIIAMHND